MKTPDRIHLNPGDNVSVVVTSGGEIPRGHKIAVLDIPKGSPVIKFGHIIGITTAAIPAGHHVHTHNVRMPTPQDLKDWSSRTQDSQSKYLTREDQPILNSVAKTFQGYARENGEAGTRNYLVVTASVNCSASVVKAICRRFENRSLEAQGIHGIIPITHSQGCAQEIGGLGYKVLNRTLAGWITHPNVVGAVVIGLGCEGTTFKSILKSRAVLEFWG